MKKISTLLLIIAILGACGECIDIYNNGVDLNMHIPFLWPVVILFFWGITLIAMASQGRTSSEQLRSLIAANDDGRIPEHARMRANTPDGLG